MVTYCYALLCVFSDADISVLFWNSDSAASPTQLYDICPFSHCVPWRTILLDATNVTLPSSLSSVVSYFPDLIEASDVIYLNISRGHVTPVYAVRMPSENHGWSIGESIEYSGNVLCDFWTVTKLLTTGTVKNVDGRNVSVTRGHVVSPFICFLVPMLVVGCEDVV